jgi:hypothetical protein
MTELACCAFASSLEAPRHRRGSSTRHDLLHLGDSRQQDVLKYLKLARMAADEKPKLEMLRPKLVSGLRAVGVCPVEEG